MPPAAEVQKANPEHLANNTFLVNLAVTFNVTSIPLAIFILILVCIACVLFVVFLLWIVKSCIRRKFIPKKRKKPFKSVYLDEIPGAVPESVHRFGSLEYSLEYDLDRAKLKVGVIQANNLVVRPEVDTLDPYVSVTMYKQHGDKLERCGKVQKTGRKHTNQPSWHQQFEFDLVEKDIKKTTFVFDVYDYDSIGQDSHIGQCRVQMKDLDEAEYVGKIMENIGWLSEGGPMIDGIGQICLGTCYQPQLGKINVNILEARQLQINSPAKNTKEPELYVNVTLDYKETKKLGSFDSRPVEEQANPYFNEKTSFSVKPEKIENCSIKCRLKRNGRVGKRKTLGYAILGPMAPVTTGVKQWEEMLRAPNRTHVMWHVLTPKSQDKNK